jgi:hypothetical protein
MLVDILAAFILNYDFLPVLCNDAVEGLLLRFFYAAGNDYGKQGVGVNLLKFYSVFEVLKQLTVRIVRQFWKLGNDTRLLRLTEVVTM